jgi:hypothetical protein
MSTDEELERLGLRRSPFDGTPGDGAFYLGPQHREAVSFLERALHSVDLLVALTGDPGAGKSAVLDYTLKHEFPGALAARLSRLAAEPEDFLADLLTAFGFEGLKASRDEMRGLVGVYLGHQRQKGVTTVIVAENPVIVPAGVIEEIGWLSLLEPVRLGRLKLVLLGGDPLERQLIAPRMHALRQMIRWQHRLEGMGLEETRDYLEFHVEAAGAPRPAEMFSAEAAVRIHECTGGLPARINLIAAKALQAAAAAGELPVGVERVDAVVGGIRPADRQKPRRVASLDISLDRAPKARIGLTASRLLIGRHPWNDVQLDDDSVSRHHAMLVREAGHWTIVDLNSTNGIRVNDRDVRQQRLRHGDVVQVGRFRLVLNEGVGPARTLPSAGDYAETTVLPS